MKRYLLPIGLLLLPFEAFTQTHYDPNVLPKGQEYFELRDGLANSHLKFAREKTGRIAFLGGSITAGGGWGDHTMKYFQQKFPDTKFEFIGAGIGSMGSVPHAFRLERDVLKKGPIDLLFVEAPRNSDEMGRVCAEAPGVHMANMVEDGDTPLLVPAELEAIGYRIVAYPLTLLSASIRAMESALTALRAGRAPDNLLPFETLREIVGFPDYDVEQNRYRID